jgi:hypothetical protein
MWRPTCARSPTDRRTAHGPATCSRQRHPSAACRSGRARCLPSMPSVPAVVVSLRAVHQRPFAQPGSSSPVPAWLRFRAGPSPRVRRSAPRRNCLPIRPHHAPIADVRSGRTVRESIETEPAPMTSSQRRTRTSSQSMASYPAIAGTIASTSSRTACSVTDGRPRPAGCLRTGQQPVG